MQGGLSARVRDAMVNALAEAGWADDPHARQILIDKIGDYLGRPLSIANHLMGRDHLGAVVDACCEATGGLDALLHAVRLMRPRSPEYARIERLVEQAWVLDVLPGTELDRLHGWLADLRVHQLPTLVARSCGPGVPLPPSGADAWQVVWHLTAYNAGADGLPPVLIFVELLARQVGDRLGRKLAQWAEDQARTLGLTAELAARRESLPAAIPPDTRLHLLIAVEQDAIDADLVMVSHWRQDDPEQWPPARSNTDAVHLADLEQQVDKIIVAAERAWAEHEGSVSVEFLLPRALLNLPVHRWHKEHDSGDPRPLCLDYPIVVRSLERMGAAQWHRLWLGRWRSMNKGSSAANPHIAGEDDTKEPHRLAAMLSESDLVSMVLTAPPSATARPGADELTAALRAGLPVVFWHCELPTSDALRDVVARLVEGNGLRELPARLLKLRRDAFLETAGSGVATVSDLVVLFDDPSRLVTVN